MWNRQSILAGIIIILVVGIVYLAFFVFTTLETPHQSQWDEIFATPAIVRPQSKQKLRSGLIQVPPPPFKDEDIFPCSDCHEPEDTNRTRRKLSEEHENIVLRHDEENRWCLDCHDANNRDRLHLASGALVKFTESYVLCGQCHGDKLRDWRVGIHGKRTGFWNGEKRYLLCVHCHDPHSPMFKPIHPEPTPFNQNYLRLTDLRERVYLPSERR